MSETQSAGRRKEGGKPAQKPQSTAHRTTVPTVTAVKDVRRMIIAPANADPAATAHRVASVPASAATARRVDSAPATAATVRRAVSARMTAHRVIFVRTTATAA